MTLSKQWKVANPELRLFSSDLKKKHGYRGERIAVKVEEISHVCVMWIREDLHNLKSSIAHS